MVWNLLHVLIVCSACNKLQAITHTPISFAAASKTAPTIDHAMTRLWQHMVSMQDAVRSSLSSMSAGKSVPEVLGVLPSLHLFFAGLCHVCYESAVYDMMPSSLVASRAFLTGH